jgi:hypothetical protein
MQRNTVLVVLSLLLVVQGARYAKFQTGYGVGPEYSRTEPEHVLQAETDPHREVEVRVEFETEFE